MNLSLFIAKRYFFSKKKSFINFLSITAFIGVMVGTSSLIIVLSVFNGLEDLLKSLYINFNPEIKIVSNSSKYFINNNNQINNINNIEGGDFVSKVIEECDVIYILVATPSLPSGDYDMQAIDNVMDDFKKYKSRSHL